MEPDELEDRTNDKDGECDVPYLDALYAEDPVQKAFQEWQDGLHRYMSLMGSGIPNFDNEESSNDE